MSETNSNRRETGVRAPGSVDQQSHSTPELSEASRNLAKQEKQDIKSLTKSYGERLDASLRNAGLKEQEIAGTKELFEHPLVKNEIITRATQMTGEGGKLESLLQQILEKKDAVKDALQERLKAQNSLKGKRVYWNSQLAKLTADVNSSAEKIKGVKDRIKSLEKEERVLAKSRLDLEKPAAKAETPVIASEADMAMEGFSKDTRDQIIEAGRPALTAENTEEAESDNLLDTRFGAADEEEYGFEKPAALEPTKVEQKKLEAKEVIPDVSQYLEPIEEESIEQEEKTDQTPTADIFKGFGDFVQGGSHPADDLTPPEISMSELKRAAGVRETDMMDETPETDTEREAREDFQDWMKHHGVSQRLLKKYPTQDAMKAYLDNSSFWSQFSMSYDTALKAYTDFISLDVAGAAKLNKRSVVGASVKERAPRVPSRLAAKNESIGEINTTVEKQIIDGIEYSVQKGPDGVYSVRFQDEGKDRVESLKTKDEKVARASFEQRVNRVKTEQRTTDIMNESVEAGQPFSYLDAKEQAANELRDQSKPTPKKSFWSSIGNLFKSSMVKETERLQQELADQPDQLLGAAEGTSKKGMRQTVRHELTPSVSGIQSSEGATPFGSRSEIASRGEKMRATQAIEDAVNAAPEPEEKPSRFDSMPGFGDWAADSAAKDKHAFEVNYNMGRKAGWPMSPEFSNEELESMRTELFELTRLKNGSGWAYKSPELKSGMTKRIAELNEILSEPDSQEQNAA